MPGSLKLNAVASIYAHNKPYNFFRSFSSSSVTVTATTNNSAVIAAVRPNFPAVSSSTRTTTTCCRRWRSATTLASSAFHGNGDFRNRKKFLGFSSAQEQNAGFPVRNISTTHMGPTPDHHNHHHKEEDEAEEEQWLDSSPMKASNPASPQNDGSGNGKASASPPEPSNSEKLLTLPTILTIGRVAAVPLLVSTFYVDSWWGPTATTALFIAAAITDWLDGYLARKMNLGTAFGAFLDPVADKLMVAATLVLLCTRPLESNVFGQLPWLLPVPSIAIIGREITMSAVREWAASQGSKLSEAVAVNNLGKWKTATQMIALTILLLSRDTSLSGTGSHTTLVASGVILLYISAWLAVWSLFVYMRKILKALM